MAFYVYILQYADGSYYNSHSDNLENCIAAHEDRKIPGHTERRRPIKLVFAEDLSSREDAIARERQIKGWSRAKKEALINSDWERLVELSKSRQNLV